MRAPAPGLTRPVGTALAVALVVTTAGCRSDRRDLDDLAATARSAADEVAGRIGGRVETITDELTGAACSASGDPRGPRSLSYLLRVDTDRADPLAAARAAAADLPRSADGGWRVREREDAPGGDDLLALVGPDVTVTVVVRADPDEPVDVVAGTDCVG